MMLKFSMSKEKYVHLSCCNSIPGMGNALFHYSVTSRKVVSRIRSRNCLIQHINPPFNDLSKNYKEQTLRETLTVIKANCPKNAPKPFGAGATCWQEQWGRSILQWFLNINKNNINLWWCLHISHSRDQT